MEQNPQDTHATSNQYDAKALDYRSYWSGFLLQNPEVKRQYPDAKTAVAHTDKWLQRMDSAIEQNYDDIGRCYANEVTNWYYRLGSLNHLHGAEDTLIKAGLIMERRGEDEDCSDRDCLLTGCLFHEAVELLPLSDSKRWADRALEHYERLIADVQTDELSIHRQSALRYAYDLQYKQLFMRAHQLRRRGEFDYTDLNQRYAQLQQMYIDEFVHINAKALQEAGNSTDLGTHKGVAFEWFAVLAYRHAMWRNNKLGTTVIRSGFPREDSPWMCADTEEKHRLPKQGVDVVVDKYQAGNWQHREHIQLKAGKSSRQYLDRIKTIGANSNSDAGFIRLLNDSAELMRRQYEGDSLQPSEHTTIQKAVELVRPRLIEPAA